jgi:RES domain-containing protein
MTGASAAREGGRWNPPGDLVVYTADTMALAALETLVHLDGDFDLADFSLLPCTFARSIVTEFDARTLPHGWTWNASVTQAIGHDWITGAKTAVLRVPTAVVPLGWNYLINPRHPDFAKIRVGTAVPFLFDPRLR